MCVDVGVCVEWVCVDTGELDCEATRRLDDIDLASSRRSACAVRHFR